MKRTNAVFGAISLLAMLGLATACDCDHGGGSSDIDDDTVAPTDDDTVDDDTGDHVDVTAQYIAGGAFSGAALALDPAGDAHVVSQKSRQMRVYSPDGDQWGFTVALFGAFANPSAAYGPDGALHLAYYDWYGGYLWHAHNTGGAWASEIVDQSGDVGHYSSIMVDTNNVVHIAYDREISRAPVAVRYAQNSSGHWATEDVEQGDGVGAFPCLTIDPSGAPYLTYNAGDNAVHLARQAGDSWQVVSFDDGRPYNRSSAVVVDGEANLYVAYRAEAGVVFQTGKWGALSAETVDSATAVGDSLSLAVDPSGVARVSYYDSANARTMYADNAAKAWTVTQVGEGYPVFIRATAAGEVTISLGDLGVWVKAGGEWTQTYFDRGYSVDDCAIGSDAQGHQHIIYIDHTGQSLRYATNAGESWQTQILQNVIGGDAHGVSLAVDGAGKNHVSFYNDLTHGLIYATDESGSWVFVPVEAGNVGTHNSLALDADGHVHIAYHDESSGALKYATNRSGDWQTHVVDGEGVVGVATSIAFESTGRVDIAYEDASDGDINLARGADDSWTIEVVDENGGDFVSLALDDADAPHIFFVGDGLRYAEVASGDWFTWVIDATALSAPVAAVFENGSLKAAYQGVDNNLRYANGRQANWALQTVDEIGDVGSHLSMTLGDDGHKYIAYVAEGALWLAVIE
jgi:hypothetical protein